MSARDDYPCFAMWSTPNWRRCQGKIDAEIQRALDEIDRSRIYIDTLRSEVTRLGVDPDTLDIP